MLKENAIVAPVSFDRQDGGIGTAGGVKGKVGTRRKFPQVSANLAVRWCSASLKIDTAALALNNEPAFKNGPILFLTGERREESAARSQYAEMETHRCSTRSRRVDALANAIDRTERQVWAMMEKHNINPHPAYWLGWGRVSCLACIFGMADQWASVRAIAPDLFDRIAALRAGLRLHDQEGPERRGAGRQGQAVPGVFQPGACGFGAGPALPGGTWP